MAIEHTYPTIFTDARGREETTLVNDGCNLRMRLRGVEFSGQFFDDFEPTDAAAPLPTDLFDFYFRELCSYRIECRIPVPVQTPAGMHEGALHVDLKLGDPNPPRGLDEVTLQIDLVYDGVRIAGGGKSGWFEDELLSLQSQLPDGVYLKACINCMYSDYSIYGHGTFGCMMCFRKRKEAYLQVKSKRDYCELGGPVEDVQETHLCPEFERRRPGVGYRG